MRFFHSSIQFAQEEAMDEEEEIVDVVNVVDVEELEEEQEETEAEADMQ